jgi:D-alanyl-D-alanine carboxypeptidase
MRERGHCRVSRWASFMAAFFLVLIATISVISCNKTATESEAKEFSPQIVQRLEEVLAKGMEVLRVPGAVVGVWTSGEGAWVAARGLADRDAGREMQAEDLLRIGSITKTFTATVVLQLAEEGLISLDDTLEAYFPDMPHAGEITVRQLLNHTSGIWDDYGEEFMAIAENDMLKEWGPQELLDVTLSFDPDLQPGERFHYANANYILAGMLIEQVTGNDLAVELQERIFEPLGLAHTSFAEGPQMSGDYSHGYTQEEPEADPVDITGTMDPSMVWAAGAIVSNLEDLEIWAPVLAKGELLSPRMQEERLTWVDAAPPESPGVEFRYGLGISDDGGYIGHNGMFAGYNSSMYYLPSRDATLVVLINNGTNPAYADLILIELAKVVFPDDIPQHWVEASLE